MRRSIVICLHSRHSLPVRVLLIVLIAAFSWQYAKAQVPVASDQRIIDQFWTFKDGAPELPRTFAQTVDGYLWLGGEGGLFRFDGVRFELFRSPFGDQLPSTAVSGLFAPASGGLWVGYVFGGFSFLKNGRVSNYVHATGTVFGFAQDVTGIVWAATSGGLWRFDGSTWQHIGSEWGLIPWQAVAQAGFDREGTLWALAGSRDHALAKQLYFLLPSEKQFRKAGENLFVTSFTWDADHFILTTHERSPQQPGSGIELHASLPAYPILKRDSDQVLDRNNGVWFFPHINPPSVWRHAAGEQLAKTVREASADDSEQYELREQDYARLVDREGSIWISTDTGVHRFSYSPLIQQELPKPPGPSFVVAPDDDGLAWISAGNGAGTSILYRVGAGKLELQKSSGGISLVAYRAPDKTFWFGGEGGLWHMVNGRLTKVELPSEMADTASFLTTITADASGAMWVAFGGSGLYRLKDGAWTKYEEKRDFPDPLTVCPRSGVVIAFTDTLSRVWFGCTKSQVAVLEGDRMQTFGPKEGVGVGNVTAIFGRGSEIWIGGEFGLQQFDHGRFHTIHGLDKESFRGISGIIETANGDVWLNGLGGIVHVRRAEILQALKNPDYQVNSERFDRRAGLPGLPSQLAKTPTAVEGTDGRLWFTVNGGVVWLDPNQASNKVPPPSVAIQSIAADGKGYVLDPTVRFPAHTSSVQISYAAVSLLNPEAIRYRYKLREIDTDWHDAATSTDVSYRNLAPGAYHFVVGSSDTNGVWSDKTASVEFRVLPAFYQTKWFRVLCAMAFVGLLWAAYELRVRQLNKQFEMTLNARVDERTRIARDLHDTLLQSAHGLLLRFQTVSQLLPDRPMDAKERLDNAIEQTAEFITEARDEVQGLRASTVETNDLALAISTVGEELAVDCADHRPVFHVAVEGEPRNLHPILRDEIYKIATEALRNAFCHSQARRIEVEIRYDSEQFRLRVRDDGKGIDPALLSARNNEGHYGLQGMRERATLIGGKLVVWSEVGAGTEVELRVASNIAFAAGRKHDRVTGNSAGIAKA